MRDLDGKHLITGDFIAVSGDVISNFPIDDVLAKHRSRRQKDRNAIMTMVLREAGARHRTKSSSISPVFVVDPTKDRCLHYEEIDHYDKSSPARLNIDTEILTSHAELDVRQDLIDCNIDICTPDVLSLWSDSFDYQAPRKHFLYGVLKDYELNGKTIHTHIIKEHYAARVRNLKAYDAVTKDIVSRWAFPLCPDTNLLPGHTYELRRGNIYQERGVILARSCIVGRRTVIGQGTSIGDRTTVTNSVLGRDCKIGKNVIIDGAYIWDGVVIGDNTEIRQAIVAEGVVVGDSCKVEPSALLSFGVKISNGVTVAQGTRVTVAPREDGSVPASEEQIVGAEGQGYEYVFEDDEDEDDVRSESSGLSRMTLSRFICLYFFVDEEVLTLHFQSTTWPNCLSLPSLFRRCLAKYRATMSITMGNEVTASGHRCPKTTITSTSNTMQRTIYTTVCVTMFRRTLSHLSWSVYV